MGCSQALTYEYSYYTHLYSILKHAKSWHMHVKKKKEFATSIIKQLWSCINPFSANSCELETKTGRKKKMKTPPLFTRRSVSMSKSASLRPKSDTPGFVQNQSPAVRENFADSANHNPRKQLKRRPKHIQKFPSTSQMTRTYQAAAHHVGKTNTTLDG